MDDNDDEDDEEDADNGVGDVDEDGIMNEAGNDVDCSLKDAKRNYITSQLGYKTNIHPPGQITTKTTV